MRQKHEPTWAELRREVPQEARTLVEVAIAAGFVPTRTAKNRLRLVRGAAVVPLGGHAAATNLGALRSSLRRAGVRC